MPTTPPQQAITFFLIKDGKKLDDVIPNHRDLELQEFSIERQEYQLYSKATVARVPSWANYFPDQVDRSKLGKSSSAGAVLLTTVDGRQYALTFGTGRFLLNQDECESGFGLKIVLNSVEMVRSIDKNSFDSINGKTRTQASRDSSIQLFGIDVERDLLKAVTGRPTDPTLGTRISGVDGVNLVARVEFVKLPELIRKLYRQSQLENYKKGDFAFVDQIRSISETSLVSKLDAALDVTIKRQTPSKITNDVELILPDIMDFSDAEFFRYKNKPRNPENLRDISLKTFLVEAQNSKWALSVDLLKQQSVYSINSNNESIKLASVYRCVLAEVSLGSRRYILSDGKWYEVSRDYLKQIESFVANAERYPVNLPLFAHDDGEGGYNEAVAASLTEFYCFDKKLLHPETGQKFEFCDLYTENHGAKDLIHVKIAKSSSSLSHLFSQGTVSAETFIDHDKCRRELNAKLLPAHLRLSDPGAKVNPSEYRVVFAIIRKKTAKLPFFARVNLRQAFRTLNKWGFRPVLAEIDIDDAWLLKKNVNKKEK